jgi:hypothetical protein
MPIIRDTIDPTREREVSDAEFTDLERQNVVLTGTRAKTDEGLRAAAVRQVQGTQAAAYAATVPTTTTPPADAAGQLGGDVEDDETTGVDPASDTDPTHTSTQES